VDLYEQYSLFVKVYDKTEHYKYVKIKILCLRYFFYCASN